MTFSLPNVLSYAQSPNNQSFISTEITTTPSELLLDTLSSYPGPNTPSLLLEETPTPITYSPYPPPNSPPIIEPTVIPQNIEYSFKYFLPIIYRSAMYNRDFAINYADIWAHDRNPAFPNFGTDYDCTDCTNFLSQVLYSGRLIQIMVDGSYRDWYIWCDEAGCTYSDTWAITPLINQHSAYYANLVQRFKYYSSAYELQPGDFFLIDLRTNPDGTEPSHARVSIGWGYPEEGDRLNEWQLLASSHCMDRKRVRWDYLLPDKTYYWPWGIIY